LSFDIADELNVTSPSSFYHLGPFFEILPSSQADILQQILNLLVGNVVLSFNGRTGVVVSIDGDYTASQVTNVPAGTIAAVTVQAALDELDTDKAPLVSPTFSGVPTGPTAAPLTNSAQLATTAYVDTAVTSASVSDGDKGDINVSAFGTVWTIEPSVVLTGNPTTTTQTPGDNSTKIATTAYVDAVAAGVISDGDKGDIVVSSSGTVWTIDTSVALAGNPTTTTQSAGNNSTRIATTAYVDAAAAASTVADGDKGDITVSSSGTVWTVDGDAITYAKMQNVSAGSKVLGRGDSGSGDVQEITLGSNLTITGTTLSATGGASTTTQAITCVFNGGGSVIGTGIHADLYIPFAATITAAHLLADNSGSMVVDIWKDTYANYPPTASPDSITASAKPTLSGAIKSEDTTLTGWTTSISAGDTLRFNVDSCTVITRAVLVLTVTRTL